MTITEIARGLVIGGLLYYFFNWWWPEAGRIFGRFGVWQSAPHWLRRIAQRRGGDVHLLTVLNELWALFLVASGVGLASGVVPPQRSMLEGAIGMIIVPFAVAGVVAARRRFFRQGTRAGDALRDPKNVP